MLKKLAENLDFQTLQSLNQVNEGILDGRYSVGVTSEEAAQALRVDGADVDYIYPEEGTVVVVDGTAIRRGCAMKRQQSSSWNLPSAGTPRKSWCQI